jgi:hypothetical protein
MMSVATTKLLFGHLSIFLLAVIFLHPAIAQTQRSRTPTISVTRSSVVEEVSKRAKQQPVLSSAELAAYGNDLIAEKGFDYSFDVCDLLSERERNQVPSAEFQRTHPLALVNGANRTFRFTIGSAFESLCGECWLSLPLVQITSGEMTLIVEGNRYRVRRPPSFYLDEAQLVDASLKKVSRTWQMPYQAVPVGISADGTKLYIDFYKGNNLDDVVLELSVSGPPQFRDRGVIKSSEGEWLESHPKDPSNSYLSFMSFRVGKKTYRIKFTAPCT